jgi:hypothetical protein
MIGKVLKWKKRIGLFKISLKKKINKFVIIMSFRKYGGIQFNAQYNYVRSQVSDAGILNITIK